MASNTAGTASIWGPIDVRSQRPGMARPTHSGDSVMRCGLVLVKQTPLTESRTNRSAIRVHTHAPSAYFNEYSVQPAPSTKPPIDPGRLDCQSACGRVRRNYPLTVQWGDTASPRNRTRAAAGSHASLSTSNLQATDQSSKSAIAATHRRSLYGPDLRRAGSAFGFGAASLDRF